jgi:hypothetical protein
VAEVDDAQRQERRKKAGDLLKMADKLFKGSDFEGAARLVQMATETDPQNAYALAYQERVKYAIAQRDGTRLEAPKLSIGGPLHPPSSGDQPATPAVHRPSPEEIKKKLEQAQRNIAAGKTARICSGNTPTGGDICSGCILTGGTICSCSTTTCITICSCSATAVARFSYGSKGRGPCAVCAPR